MVRNINAVGKMFDAQRPSVPAQLQMAQVQHAMATSPAQLSMALDRGEGHSVGLRTFASNANGSPDDPPSNPTTAHVKFVDALATGSGLSYVPHKGTTAVGMGYATQAVDATTDTVPTAALMLCAVTRETFAVPASGSRVEAGGFVYVAAAHGDHTYLVRCARTADPNKDALCGAVLKTIGSAAVSDTPKFGAMVVAAHGLMGATFTSCGGTLHVTSSGVYMDSIPWCGKPHGVLNGTPVAFADLTKTPSTVSGTTIAASSPGAYTAGGVHAPAVLFAGGGAAAKSPVVLDAQGLVIPNQDMPAGQVVAINSSSKTTQNVSGRLTGVHSVELPPLAGGMVRTAGASGPPAKTSKAFSGTVKPQKSNVVATWGGSLMIVDMNGTSMPISPVAGRGAGYFAPVPGKNASDQAAYAGILYGVRNTLFVLPNTQANADAMVGAADPYTRAMRFKTPFLMRKVMGMPVWVWFVLLLVVGLALYAHHKGWLHMDGK